MAGRHRSSGNDIARKAISVVLGFLYACFGTILLMYLSLYFGFFRHAAFQKAMDKSHYINEVQELFYENANDLTIPVGLPEEVLEDIAPLDVIQKDIEGYEQASLSGIEFTFATEEVVGRLRENVYAHFEDQGQTMTKEQEEALPDYLSLIAEQYEKDVELPLVDYFPKVLGYYWKIFVILVPVLILLETAIVAILYRLYKRRYNGLRYVAYGTIAMTIMSAFPIVAALGNGFYKKLGISTRHLYRLAVAYVEGGLKTMLCAPIISAIASVVLILLIVKMKKKYHAKMHGQNHHRGSGL